MLRAAPEPLGHCCTRADLTVPCVCTSARATLSARLLSAHHTAPVPPLPAAHQLQHFSLLRSALQVLLIRRFSFTLPLPGGAEQNTVSATFDGIKPAFIFFSQAQSPSPSALAGRKSCCRLWRSMPSSSALPGPSAGCNSLSYRGTHSWTAAMSSNTTGNRYPRAHPCHQPPLLHPVLQLLAPALGSSPKEKFPLLQQRRITWDSKQLCACERGDEDVSILAVCRVLIWNVTQKKGRGP